MWWPKAKPLWQLVCDAFNKVWRPKAKSSRQLVYEALHGMNEKQIKHLIVDDLPRIRAEATRLDVLRKKTTMIDFLMRFVDTSEWGLDIRRALNVDTDEELALKAAIDAGRGARVSARFAGITVLVSLSAVLLAYCRPAQQPPAPPHPHGPPVTPAAAAAPTTTQAADPPAAPPRR